MAAKTGRRSCRRKTCRRGGKRSNYHVKTHRNRRGGGVWADVFNAPHLH